MSKQFVTNADGRRLAVDSQWHWIRPTLHEAHQAVVNHYQNAVANAKDTLKCAEEQLAQAKAAARKSAGTKPPQ